MVCYNFNGTLDNTFGSGGIVTITFAPSSDIAIKSDGKIIGASTNGNATTTVKGGIFRFNTNGSIDNTFNNDGMTFIIIPGRDAVSNDNGYAVAIQPDKKIIVAGTGKQLKK